MIQYVFFDLDGVIVDSEKRHFECWQQVTEEYGVSIDWADYQKLIGKTTAVIAENFLKRYKFDASVEFLSATKRKLFDTSLTSLKITENLVGLLDYCEDRHISKAIVTSARKNVAQQILKSHNLSHYFEFIVAREDVTANKPDPEAYRKALICARCQPSMVLAIEDSTTGFNSAVTANIPCILYNRIVESELLQATPRLITDSHVNTIQYLQSLDVL